MEVLWPYSPGRNSLTTRNTRPLNEVKWMAMTKGLIMVLLTAPMGLSGEVLI